MQPSRTACARRNFHLEAAPNQFSRVDLDQAGSRAGSIRVAISLSMQRWRSRELPAFSGRSRPQQLFNVALFAGRLVVAVRLPRANAPCTDSASTILRQARARRPPRSVHRSRSGLTREPRTSPAMRSACPYTIIDGCVRCRRARHRTQQDGSCSSEHSEVAGHRSRRNTLLLGEECARSRRRTARALVRFSSRQYGSVSEEAFDLAHTVTGSLYRQWWRLRNSG